MERFQTDHSARSIAVPRLALPAVSICQPRSAKRCVSVEGGRASEDRESDAPTDDTPFIRFPLLDFNSCLLITIGDGPRRRCDVLLILKYSPPSSRVHRCCCQGSTVHLILLGRGGEVIGTRVDDVSTYQKDASERGRRRRSCFRRGLVGGPSLLACTKIPRYASQGYFFAC